MPSAPIIKQPSYLFHKKPKVCPFHSIQLMGGKVIRRYMQLDKHHNGSYLSAFTFPSITNFLRSFWPFTAITNGPNAKLSKQTFQQMSIDLDKMPDHKLHAITTCEHVVFRCILPRCFILLIHNSGIYRVAFTTLLVKASSQFRQPRHVGEPTSGISLKVH